MGARNKSHILKYQLGYLKFEKKRCFREWEKTDCHLFTSPPHLLGLRRYFRTRSAALLLLESTSLPPQPASQPHPHGHSSHRQPALRPSPVGIQSSPSPHSPAIHSSRTELKLLVLAAQPLLRRLTAPGEQEPFLLPCF